MKLLSNIFYLRPWIAGEDDLILLMHLGNDRQRAREVSTRLLEGNEGLDGGNDWVAEGDETSS